MTSTPYQFLCDESRVSFGGDEFVFVEFGEAMDLAEALRIQAITAALTRMAIAGIVDVAPANASYMIRLDPEHLDPRHLVQTLDGLHKQFADSFAVTLDTDIVEIPVWYDDPSTSETCMKFRDRHQSPSETDIQYTARVNDYSSVDDSSRRTRLPPSSSHSRASSRGTPRACNLCPGTGRFRHRSIFARARRPRPRGRTRRRVHSHLPDQRSGRIPALGTVCGTRSRSHPDHTGIREIDGPHEVLEPHPVSPDSRRSIPGHSCVVQNGHISIQSTSGHFCSVSISR